MLHPDGSTDFTNINTRVPDIYSLPKRELNSLANPRILKSHEYFDPRYPKTLYVVRDVRSVLISYFHHMKLTARIDENTAISDFAEMFMAGTADSYGDWQDNVTSWIRVRANNPDRFRLLRYEDLQTNPHESCETIYEFLGLDRSDGAIANCLELSAFKRMKSLEAKGIDQKMLARKVKKNVSGFVRSGKSGDWKETIPHDILRKIERKYGDLLTELGYPI